METNSSDDGLIVATVNHDLHHIRLRPPRLPPLPDNGGDLREQAIARPQLLHLCRRRQPREHNLRRTADIQVLVCRECGREALGVVGDIIAAEGTMRQLIHETKEILKDVNYGKSMAVRFGTNGRNGTMRIASQELQIGRKTIPRQEAPEVLRKEGNQIPLVQMAGIRPSREQLAEPSA